MKKASFYFVAVFLALLLQTTVLSYLIPGAIIPDLMLIFVVITGFISGPKDGLLVGGGAGLLQDIFITINTGYYTFLKLLFGLFSGFWSKKVFKENFIFPPLFIFLFTMIQFLAVDFLDSGIGFSSNFLQMVWRIMLPESFVNFLLGIIFYPLLVKIMMIYFGDKKI